MFRSKIWMIVGVLSLALAAFVGCGSDDDTTTPAVPTDLELTVDDDALWVGEETTIEAALLYDREDAPDCDWYVNGELGGSAANGTITQDNPATYAAPDPAPGAGHVVIEAVWADDETIEGSETITVATPVVQVLLPSTHVQVAETVQVDARLGADPRAAAEFEWYVNNVLGGNETVGTITQTTPATYVAPDEIPVGDAVEIKARWTVNPELYHATANLGLKFTIKHVNAATGVDDPDGGRITAPFKTISYALQLADQSSVYGDTILVAPGTYGADLGEQFPQIVSNQAILRGADRNTCFIDALPDESNIFWMFNGTVERFTFRNPGYPDNGTSNAIMVQGSATIREITINDPFNNSAIKIMNPNVVGVVEDCELNNTADPGVGRGIEFNGPAQGVIRNCAIWGWDRGVYAAGNEGPTHLIENCSIKSNREGVHITSECNVDLGGGSEGSLGGNAIQLNEEFGINCSSVHDIYALSNTWNEWPPVECEFEIDAPCDFYTNGSGTIIWE